MENTQDTRLLLAAIDLLTQRRKPLKFLTHSCGAAYRAEAQEQLAVVEAKIQSLRFKLAQQY